MFEQISTEKIPTEHRPTEHRPTEHRPTEHRQSGQLQRHRWQAIRVFAILLVATFLPLCLQAQDRADDLADEQIEPEPIHEFYAAVWHDDADPAQLEQSDDPPNFNDPEGFDLDDIQVWLADGQRKYLGVFRTTTGGNRSLVGPLDKSDFESARLAQHGQGRCLAGFELWSESGQTFYAGVFRPDVSQTNCGEERFEVDLDVVEFSAKLQSYGASHHLVDFETVATDGELRISGLWQLGPEAQPTFALLGVSWDSYHELAHDLTEDNYRLVDLDVQFGEPIHQGDANPPGGVRQRRFAKRQGVARHHPGPNGSREMISGVWRAGAGTDWLGVNYQWNHVSCAHRLLNQGFGDSGIVKKEVDGKMVHTTICEEPDDGQVVAPGLTLRLSAIEVYPQVLTGNGCQPREHAGPIHNSSSGGPP